MFLGSAYKFNNFSVDGETQIEPWTIVCLHPKWILWRWARGWTDGMHG